MHQRAVIERQRKQAALFPLGQIRLTFNAMRRLAREDVQRAVLRHVSGDWGDVSPDEWRENQRSLAALRLFSVYHDDAGREFWVVTDADRTRTTVLLPEDSYERNGRAASPAAESPAWELEDSAV